MEISVADQVIFIPEREIDFSAIRAQGSGGQNVNKVSSAIHLRFDIYHSSLPQWCKNKLLAVKDDRLNSEGVLIIKAQNYRRQLQNREDALARLSQFVTKALTPAKRRVATKPSRASKRARLNNKSHRSKLKSSRQRVTD